MERVIFSNSLNNIVAVKCHRRTLLAKDFDRKIFRFKALASSPLRREEIFFPYEFFDGLLYRLSLKTAVRLRVHLQYYPHHMMPINRIPFLSGTVENVFIISTTQREK